jgi:hypothetical protein
LDTDTRRQKQQALITDLLERKIRLHAQNLYEKRGQAEGLDVQDWVEAEAQVLGNSILAPLYRKTQASRSSDQFEDGAQPRSTESSTSEAGA